MLGIRAKGRKIVESSNRGHPLKGKSREKTPLH